MSYLGRVWMAASVAVVQGGQSDAHHEATRGVISLHQTLRVSYGETAADLLLHSNRNGDEKRQADESLRRVMYFNCWGQG